MDVRHVGFTFRCTTACSSPAESERDGEGEPEIDVSPDSDAVARLQEDCAVAYPDGRAKGVDNTDPLP